MYICGPFSTAVELLLPLLLLCATPLCSCSAAYCCYCCSAVAASAAVGCSELLLLLRAALAAPLQGLPLAAASTADPGQDNSL